MLLKSFDFIIQKECNFKKIATDSDDQNRTEFCTGNIKIIDVYYNYPVFGTNEYDFIDIYLKCQSQSVR